MPTKESESEQKGRDALERIMGEYFERNHMHEPCDVCLQRDKGIALLKEELVQAEAESRTLAGRVIDMCLNLGDTQEEAEAIVASLRERKIRSVK